MGARTWGEQGAKGAGKAEIGIQGLGPAGEKGKEIEDSGSTSEDPSFHYPGRPRQPGLPAFIFMHEKKCIKCTDQICAQRYSKSLHRNLQVANFQRCKMCSHVRSSKLVLFEEALLVFEAQDPNAEQYMKATATFQNATQCYHVTYDEEKRATTQISLD